MYKSGAAIVRSYIMYRPHLIFISLGIIFLIAGLVPYIRFVILFAAGNRGDHIQSLLLGAVLIFSSAVAFALTVIADLTHTNRTLLEDALERTKRIQFEKNSK